MAETYYIYEIPGVKVGCTTDMVRRQKQQRDKGEMILLESYNDIQKASERERELQVDKGYNLETTTYNFIVNKLQPLSNTPQAIAKMLANTDQEKRGKSISKALKGVKKTKEHKLKLREANLGKTIPLETRKKISETSKKWTGDRGVSKRKRPVVQLDLNHNPIKIWGCAKEVQLTIPGIWETPIGERCRKVSEKPYKGYYWEYA